VKGSVNLYASAPRAFVDKHEAIAEIFEAWAPGAVSNADLDFDSRTVAQQAPRLLCEEMRVQVAVGILMMIRRASLEEARDLLRDAARRAGVAEAAVAESLIAGAAQDDPRTED
jgi:hypothetical protein